MNCQVDVKNPNIAFSKFTCLGKIVAQSDRVDQTTDFVQSDLINVVH